MKGKHFNVIIVNIKQKERIVLRDSFSQYMKEKHFHANFVNIRRQECIVLTLFQYGRMNFSPAVFYNIFKT